MCRGNSADGQNAPSMCVHMYTIFDIARVQRKFAKRTDIDPHSYLLAPSQKGCGAKLRTGRYFRALKNAVNYRQSEAAVKCFLWESIFIAAIKIIATKRFLFSIL